MKKTLSYVIAALSIFSRILAPSAAFAQTAEKPSSNVVESKTMKDAREIRGLKIVQIKEQMDNFLSNHHELKVKKYNQAGFITSDTLHYLNSATKSYELIDKHEYKYDERNNLKSDETFRPDPKSGAIVSYQRLDLVFDNNGLKQSECYTDTSHSENIEAATFKYENNNNTLYEKMVAGKLVEIQKRKFDAGGKEVLCERTNGAGELAEKTVTSYNAAGEKTETLVYFGGDNKPSRRVTYDKFGNTTGIYIFVMGKIVETTIMEYDEAGNITNDTCADNGVLRYRAVYKYDERKNMIEKSHFYKGALEHKIMCKYDEAGNRVEEKFYNTDDNRSAEVKLAEVRNTVYNAAHKPVEIAVYNGAGKLINKTTFEYETAK